MEVPAAEVRVTAQHTFPRVTYAHPSGDIRAQLGAGPHTVALGLTQASTSLAVEVRLKAVPSPDPDVLCARPQVAVTLRHARLEIWIAHELEPDACAADVVLQHELRHVAIERDTLDWAAAQLTARIRVWYEARVLQGSETQIKAELVQDFAQMWTPELEALLEAGRPRHAELDRRDSYGDDTACGGELFRTARRLQ